MEGSLKNPMCVHVRVCMCVCVCVCVEEQQGIKMPPALQSELPSSSVAPGKLSAPLLLCPPQQSPGRASVSLGVAPEQQSSGKRGLELLASQYKTLSINTENLHELPE